MSLPRPPGYVPPPPPTAGDVFRTARVVAVDIVAAAARLAFRPASRAGSTTTAEGLRDARAGFSVILARLGVVLEVLDADRLPTDGGLVLMWNQESHLDHLVLAAAIPRPFFSIFNNEVARTPIYGAHMRRTGHVHVDRSDEAQWRVSLARAAERVRLGECVLVSPEGTRSWDGELLPMKRGACLLAASSTRPIVCVTVIGGHARMPRGSAVVRAGPLRVVFSEPIANEGDASVIARDVAATFTRLKAEHAL